MLPTRHLAQLLASASMVAMAGCSSTPETIKGMVQTPGTIASTTVPMMVEGDQIVIPIEVEWPDGTSQTVLANVNMGLWPPFLQKHLYTALGIDRGKDLSIRIGGMQGRPDDQHTLMIKRDGLTFEVPVPVTSF